MALLLQAINLLGKFISVREPNIKYLGLENMVRLAEVPAVNDVISRCAAAVLWCFWPRARVAARMSVGREERRIMEWRAGRRGG